MKYLFNHLVKGPIIGLLALCLSLPYLGLFIFGYLNLPWFEFSEETEQQIKELIEFIARIARPGRDFGETGHGFISGLFQGLVLIYLAIMFFHQIQRFAGIIAGFGGRRGIGVVLLYYKSWVFLPGVFLALLIASAWWFLLPALQDWDHSRGPIDLLLNQVTEYDPWNYAISHKRYLIFGAICSFFFFALFGLIGIDKSIGRSGAKPRVGKKGIELLVFGSLWFLFTGLFALELHRVASLIISNALLNSVLGLFCMHGLIFYSIMSGVSAVLLRKAFEERLVVQMLDRGQNSVQNPDTKV